MAFGLTFSLQLPKQKWRLERWKVLIIIPLHHYPLICCKIIESPLAAESPLGKLSIPRVSQRARHRWCHLQSKISVAPSLNWMMASSTPSGHSIGAASRLLHPPVLNIHLLPKQRFRRKVEALTIFRTVAHTILNLNINPLYWHKLHFQTNATDTTLDPGTSWLSHKDLKLLIESMHKNMLQCDYHK